MGQAIGDIGSIHARDHALGDMWSSGYSQLFSFLSASARRMR